MHRRLLSSALLAGLVAACGAPPPAEPDTAPDAAPAHQAEPIIAGTTTLLPWGTRVVKVGAICSGTLINSRWVLTAKHCFPDPGGIGTTITLPNDTTAIADHIERHDTLDVALVHLASAVTVPPQPQQLYSGPLLLGKTLRCMGYATDKVVGGAFGTLREAQLTVSSTTTDEYFMPQNTLGQSVYGGDSGGPCYLVEGTSLRLAGVIDLYNNTTFDSYAVRVDLFDEWLARIVYASSFLGPVTPSLFSPGSVLDADTRVKLADVDGVKGADLVFPASTSVQVALADGAGGFQPLKTTALAPGSGWDVAAQVVDMTGDNKADFVFPGDTQLYIAPSTGAGTFFPPVPTTLGGGGWQKGTRLADVDGVKGADYLWVGTDAVWVGLSKGDGTVTPPTLRKKWTDTDWDRRATFVQVDGFNGADFVFPGEGTIWAYALNAVGDFGPEIKSVQGFAGPWEPYVRMADVNDDKKADWVAIRDHALHVQLATAFGSFGPMVTTLIEWGSSWEKRAVLVDISGDGRADFIAQDGGAIYVKLAVGDGTFGPMKLMAAGGPLGQPAHFVDVNGDKKADAVYLDDTGVTTMLSTLTTTSHLPITEEPPPDPIDPSKLVGIVSFWDYWGIESPIQRICRMGGCLFMKSASDKDGTGSKSSGLLASLRVDRQGLAVRGLLVERSLGSGWDWMRDQELLAAADLDKDGRDELVVRDGRGLALLGEDGQGALRLRRAQAWESSVGGWTLRPEDRLEGTGDVDGDGRVELLFADKEGARGLLRLGQDGLETLAVYPADTEWGGNRLRHETYLEAVADHDGDGRADAVLRGDAGWTLLRGTDAGFEPVGFFPYGEPLAEDPLEPESTVAAVGRFLGGDGQELLVRTHHGLTLVRPVKGWLEPVAFIPYGTWMGEWPLEPEDRVLRAGDVDGDGRDELLVHGHEGVSLSSLVQAYPVPLAVWRYGDDSGGWKLDSGDTLSPAGDLDGDQRGDLVVRRESAVGVVSWGQQGPAWLWWSMALGRAQDGVSDTVAASVMADLDGDGARELLAADLRVQPGQP